jgi:hypothetical protein
MCSEDGEGNFTTLVYSILLSVGNGVLKLKDFMEE